MRYGHFDDANKEYVVDRPDTPGSWMNYLGTRAYGGVVTNNAGGYSFRRTAANGRFLRLRFNSIPMDQPGRYVYLRDREGGEYWSASWQPVGKPLDSYASTCRFGTGYAIIDSTYAGIRTSTTYFVPLGESFEYWRLRVTNTGEAPRELDLFTYCEFASEWNIFQDNFNLQYSAYIVRADMVDGMVSASSLGNLPPIPDNFMTGDQGRWWWMGVCGADVIAHDLDREAFLGPYRSYHNPIAVESGACSNSTAYGGNACGGLQCALELAPGESKDVIVLLGVGKAAEEGARVSKEFGTVQRCEKELARLKESWHARLGTLVAQTPDAEFDSMVNVWNAFNALMTFAWSRACSLVYTGDNRDGYGFRDTVQDCLGAIPMVSADVRDRLVLMLSGQESTGGARPEINPIDHAPGSMPLTPPGKYRSDDCLWFFNSVPAYVAETGDAAFYDEVVPYSDAGETTVLGHLRRALEFNLEHTGAHGLPCGMAADWNDCLKFGFNGESMFVALQLRYGLATYAEIATFLGRTDQSEWATAELAKLDATLQRHGWDGAWFRRGFREDGSMLGSKDCEEGRIFLNAQSWAVISGAATDEQARSAMAAVDEHLATEYGVMVCTPPYVKATHDVVRAVLFNPGQKENGAIFCHPQGWAVMADCMLGEGDRAYRHYRSYMPSAYNDRAEIRQIEPYVHCQSTDGSASPRAGRSHVPWLSGTAAWSYYTATQYILGIRPELGGLRVDPCIPTTWDGFTARRRFRGKEVSITVKNPDGKSRGVTKLVIDGETIDGNVIPADRIVDGMTVEAVIG